MKSSVFYRIAAVIAIVAWTRFFMAPGIFASAIALCLILASRSHLAG